MKNILGLKNSPVVDQMKNVRFTVPEEGVDGDEPTSYESEVKFENIRAKVNCVRVKDTHAEDGMGVAKGTLFPVPVVAVRNDASATAQAMKKRCDNAPSMPDENEFLRGHTLIMDKFDQMPVMHLGREEYEAYFRTCAPSKAERLRDVLDNSTDMSYDGERKHVFAKQEALLKEHGSQPRIVYQGTDMYNALVGTVVCELSRRMKIVHSAENPRNVGRRVIYAPGVSAEKLAEIICTTPGQTVESDFKNNDGSQSGAMRKYEALYYKKLGAPLWFVRHFAKQTGVTVWTRYGITARVEGQRWSGEGTTTTGNSYAGMVIMLAAMDEANVKESTCIHGGDDILGVVSKADVETVASSMKSSAVKCGMKAEVSTPSRNKATFYRKRYLRSSNGYHPVPQMGRALAKLNIRANYNTNVSDREYMAGKYMSAAYEHRHVPLVGKLLLESSYTMSDKPYFDDRTVKINEMGGNSGIEKAVLGAKCVDADTWGDFLYDVYGIQVEDLVSVYSAMAESAQSYLDGWCTVTAKNKKVPIGKVGYEARILDNPTVRALVTADV